MKPGYWYMVPPSRRYKTVAHGIVPTEPKEMTTYTVSFVGIEIRDCVKAMERLIRIKIGHSRSIKSKEYYRTFAQKISRKNVFFCDWIRINCNTYYSPPYKS